MTRQADELVAQRDVISFLRARTDALEGNLTAVAHAQAAHPWALAAVSAVASAAAAAAGAGATWSNDAALVAAAIGAVALATVAGTAVAAWSTEGGTPRSAPAAAERDERRGSDSDSTSDVTRKDDHFQQ